MDGELLIVYQHHANFGDCKHCGKEDRRYLICHVILQDHLIKVLWDTMSRSSSR